MNQRKKLQSYFSLLMLIILSIYWAGCTTDQGDKRSPLKSLSPETQYQELITKIKDIVPGLIEREDIAGLSIALITEGKLQWAEGFGFKNTTSGKPVTKDTVFEACSLSKPVFAYGVLKMIDKGILQIDLDTPLIKYVPEEYIEKEFLNGKITDPRLRKITARMVLTHSSGFPNWRSKKKVSIGFEPGEKFSYSGEGFVYLQKVVEKITGEELNDLMQEYVFKPLNMSNSSYLWEERYKDQAAFPHSGFGNPKPLRKAKKAIAAASLHTTAPDYARFVAAILTHHMLHPQITSQYDKTGKIPWGLGVGLQQLKQGFSVWHWGDNDTFKCFFVAFQNEKKGLVYFTNSFNGLNIVAELVTGTLAGEHPIFSTELFKDYNGDIGKIIRIIKTEPLEKAIEFFKELKKKTPFLREKSKWAVSYVVGFFADAAEWLHRYQKTQDALRLLSYITDEYPDSSAAYTALAKAYELSNNKELAMKYYKKARELNPKN